MVADGHDRDNLFRRLNRPRGLHVVGRDCAHLAVSLRDQLQLRQMKGAGSLLESQLNIP